MAINSKNSSSRLFMIIFVLLFAAVGAYFIFTSFAASQGLKMEAESMKLARYARSVSDSSASGSKAVKVSKAKRGYHLTGSLTSKKPLKSITLKAKATPCGGNQYPSATVYVKNAAGQRTKVLNASINSSSYKSYPASFTKLTSSDQKFEVQVYYSTYSRAKKCRSTIYLDSVSFNGSGGSSGTKGGKKFKGGTGSTSSSSTSSSSTSSTSSSGGGSDLDICENGAEYIIHTAPDGTKTKTKIGRCNI